MRVNPRVIRVQDMRRKWGSCSSKGTLALASDLADQDSRFQDYVIVHELLHLRVPNHGRLFKALMTAYVPGWRRVEAQSKSILPKGPSKSRGTVPKVAKRWR